MNIFKILIKRAENVVEMGEGLPFKRFIM
jgi:hypothetical protein